MDQTDESSVALDNTEEIDIADVVEELGWGPYQICLFLLTGFCWLGDAMELMLMSFLPNAAQCSFYINDSERAFLSTVVFIGMIFGCVFWGWVSDTFGRRKAFIAGNTVTSISAIVTLFSNTYWVLALCRVFVGFGCASVHVPIALFTEYCPKNGRGKAIITLAIIYTMGLLATTGIAWGTLKYFPMDVAWRYLVGFCAIPVTLVALVGIFVPESSRWLLIHNKRNLATKELQSVAYWNNKSFNFDKVSLRVPIIYKQSIFDLFSPPLRKITLLLWVIWLIFTFVYYGAILLVIEQTSKYQTDYVCPTLFSSLIPISNNNSTETCTPFLDATFTDTLITTSGEIPGILVAFLVVDKIGRKNTMIIGFLLSSICVFSLYICYPAKVAIIVVFIMRAVNAGAFQTVWIYTPEIYPTTVRAIGTGTCAAVSRIGGMVSPYVMVYLVSVSREGHFSALGITAGLSLLASFCIFMLPFETTNTTIPETITPMKGPTLLDHKTKSYTSLKRESRM